MNNKLKTDQIPGMFATIRPKNFRLLISHLNKYKNAEI
jgi:hypothetical protein